MMNEITEVFFNEILTLLREYYMQFLSMKYAYIVISKALFPSFVQWSPAIVGTANIAQLLFGK